MAARLHSLVAELAQVAEVVERVERERSEVVEELARLRETCDAEKASLLALEAPSAERPGKPRKEETSSDAAKNDALAVSRVPTRDASADSAAAVPPTSPAMPKFLVRHSATATATASAVLRAQRISRSSEETPEPEAFDDIPTEEGPKPVGATAKLSNKGAMIDVLPDRASDTGGQNDEGSGGSKLYKRRTRSKHFEAEVSGWERLVVPLLQSTLRCYIARDCWQAPMNELEGDDSSESSFGSRDNHDGIRHVWEMMASRNGGGHKSDSLKRISNESARSSEFRYKTKCERWGILVRRGKIPILLPHSMVRIAWNMACLVMIGYDVFRMTFEVFNPGPMTILLVGDWCRRCFWLVDIAMSFTTGYFTNRSLEVKRWAIARHYAKTWLFFDFLALSTDWFLWLSGFEHHERIRYLNVVRLVRLAKLVGLVRLLLETVNSLSRLLLIKLLGVLCSMLFWVHLSCCAWYALGTAQGGWVEEYLEPDAEAIYAYMSSAHWSVVQFQGSTEVGPTGNMSERLFAVLVVFVDIVILAVFFSKLTNVTLELQKIWNETALHLSALSVYMERHHIPADLSVRVKKYAQWKLALDNGRNLDDERLLRLLPNALRRELVCETYRPRICQHVVFLAFDGFNQRFVERVCCDQLKACSTDPDEAIYSYGASCTDMYFVCGGDLQYFQSSAVIEELLLRSAKNTARKSTLRMSTTRPSLTNTGKAFFRKVAVNSWLCEGCLWTKWTHRGDLLSETHASLILLDGTAFGALVESYPMVRRYGAAHARRFVHVLNTAHKVSDLFDTSTAIEKIIENQFAKPAHMVHSNDSFAKQFSTMTWNSSDNRSSSPPQPQTPARSFT